MLVTIVTAPDGALAKKIPCMQDLLKSHIDYLMMSQFLFIFYMLFNHFQLKPAGFILFCMCVGSFGNALLFLIRAMNPSLKEAMTVPFRLGMTLSCSMTTIGYLSGAWLVASAAWALI
ncbi:MAG: hypothetical protein HOP02_01930 [Methylococcaceae bacterium]|nr:hypothetical protein [Methylococcaceae bacterium]